MSTTAKSVNKAKLVNLIDALNGADAVGLSDVIDEVFDPDVLIRQPLPVPSSGSQAIKDLFSLLRRAFPDLHVEVNDLIEEDGKVVSCNTVTGTHHGEYMGILPTGTSVEYDEIFVVQIVNNRIAETWGVVDVLSQMKQLGAIHY